MLPLIVLGAILLYVDHSLRRIDAVADYPDRIGQTSGTNWLLVAGESGPTSADVVLLVHIPRSGRVALVSLPSWKGNAEQLVRHIERDTGLRVDHFAQLGITGFKALDKLAAIQTYLHPSRAWDMAVHDLTGLSVGRKDHVWNLARLSYALHGEHDTVTAPTDRTAANRFFAALAEDRPLPS